MCIKENIQKVIDEFLFIESWEERYEYLIFLGKKLPKRSKNLRTNNNIIIGCQSKVWLRAYIKFNKIFFHADSDALVPKGIAALMLRIYSGQFPYEIIHNTPLFIEKIGFSSFLTSNRANGIEAMFRAIKKYAIYFQ
ncbi:putative SufE Fe/S-cluster-like protein [Candidatus Uzinura diaspidicola str. ASNER]|uniref:Putative SufE Fe/S-cluster-like protein n=1 Tax=Candidatus Uzinura diaspidicola str. ASNER TaxID=1133592 RepID=L7VMP4_9FLAO|nr:putative SufE Fe/S-cluster-like protein [Candidatus Uzinura diaspidicola str. ASNER]